MIQSLIRSLSKLPRLQGRTMEMITSPHVTTEMDPTLFEQIFTNLIFNTSDATGQGGMYIAHSTHLWPYRR
jgi:signal transduction histidine kinase